MEPPANKLLKPYFAHSLLFVKKVLCGVQEMLFDGMNARITRDRSDEATILGSLQTRGPSPRVQELGHNGKPLWTEGRVEVLTDPSAKFLENSDTVSDSSGQAIIVAEVRKGGCVYTRYPLCGYIPRAGSSGRIEESGLTPDKQVFD